jgi:hypothetical protein
VGVGCTSGLASANGVRLGVAVSAGTSDVLVGMGVLVSATLVGVLVGISGVLVGNSGVEVGTVVGVLEGSGVGVSQISQGGVGV